MSTFNKAGPHACNFNKRDSNTGVFLQICEILKNTFFTERLRWLLLKSADILATSLPITLLNKNVIAGILL